MLRQESEGIDRLRLTSELAQKDFLYLFDATIGYVSEIIKNEAQRNAPFRTGALKRSGYHEKIETLTHEIGFRVFYAIYQEFGTSKMRGHPFLRPAVYKYQDQIIKEFNDAIDEWLRKWH
jgi:HK97 gp10 family phage protein